MWDALSTVAMVVAIVWVAASLLALRDRGARAPQLLKSEVATPLADAAALPPWKRVLMIPLAILVMPPVVAVVVILVVPIVAVQLGCLACYWLRFKLLDIPMPPLGPPEA